MSLLGFPVIRYIDVSDAEEVMRACEMTDPEMPLDLCCILLVGWSSPRFRLPAQLRASAGELLARSFPADKAGALADLLSAGTSTHDYPITFEDAQRRDSVSARTCRRRSCN